MNEYLNNQGFFELTDDELRNIDGGGVMYELGYCVGSGAKAVYRFLFCNNDARANDTLMNCI